MMKLGFGVFVVCCLAMIQTDGHPQSARVSTPNVVLIQEQLQQIMDQEAKLQAMRQKLLQQLENPDGHAPQKPKTGGPIPIVGNVAFGSAAVTEPKPIPSSNGKSAMTSNYPFTEVHLESSGIRILTNKEASRRFLTS